MIHVEPAPEPSTFDALVRRPGQIAIAEMVGKSPPWPRSSGRACAQRTRKQEALDGSESEVLITREADLPSTEFPDYWTRALDDLATAYDHICAYSCFKIHEVTGARSVDHMAPKSNAWDQVYEWANYRLACSRLNARKNNFGDVLDPFEVQTGWFVLELVGFQVKPAPSLCRSLTTHIQHTIDRLKLNNFSRYREQDAEHYWQQRFTFEHLLDESPFVAIELRRQRRLNASDAIEYDCEAIRQAIAAAPPGTAKRGSILRSSGVANNAWTRAIALLCEREWVQRHGSGGGTFYLLEEGVRINTCS